MKFLKTILMAAVLMLAAKPAWAQFGAPGVFPGIPLTLAPTTRTNVNSIINLPGGNNGFAIGAVLLATNASASNVVFGLSFSFDGINFTGEKFSLIQPLNSLTNSTGYTNWTKDVFGGPVYVRLDYITNNHSGTINISNVYYHTR